ncbi:MAG TPA: cation-translocating P-type ATPase, partial [Candidatus Bathyarchaeia archaeon]|nr:cation-translocating P-type ATPase [Candidatus Bathyarchaeia archaeon]
GGEILEGFGSNRATKAIEKLIEASPKKAIIIIDGKEIEVKVEEVRVGDSVIVKPGGKIPVDGVITKGQATVNQSSLTGEAMPVEKTKDDQVYSGTIVELGALEIKATAIAEESAFGKIAHMVKEAEENRAPLERAADRYAKYFTPVILAIGLAVFLLTGDPLRLASVFVIACPCALILATPTAIVASMGNSARKGILIRNGESLEKLSDVDVLVLDKTGTVTSGQVEVVKIVAFKDSSESEIMKLAVKAEKLSEHPIARAVLRKGRQMGLEAEDPDGFEARPGLGGGIRVQGNLVTVGNERLLRDRSITLGREARDLIANVSEAATVIFVANGDKAIGALLLSDTIRDHAMDSLNKEKMKGLVKTVMLTGDNENVAKSIGEKLGIDEVLANQMPSDKVEYIKTMKTQGHCVAMVGDGINDAPALATSDVGIAMGLRGIDVAIETAGVVLAADDLSRIPTLFRISKMTIRIIKLNIIIAMAVNVLGIALAASGVLPPLLASIVHESNALVGMLNSLRLLRVD